MGEVEKLLYGDLLQTWLQVRLLSGDLIARGFNVSSVSGTEDGEMCITISPQPRRVLTVSPILGSGRMTEMGSLSVRTCAVENSPMVGSVSNSESSRLWQMHDGDEDDGD